MKSPDLNVHLCRPGCYLQTHFTNISSLLDDIGNNFCTGTEITFNNRVKPWRNEWLAGEMSVQRQRDTGVELFDVYLTILPISTKNNLSISHFSRPLIYFSSLSHVYVGDNF